jgi:hypothetical protein
VNPLATHMLGESASMEIQAREIEPSGERRQPYHHI